VCSVTVWDAANAAGSAKGNNTVDQLIALEVLEPAINFGSMGLYSHTDWRYPENSNHNTLWQRANGGSNNPCPTGWHVSTQAEWATVAGYFSPQTSVCTYNSALKLPLAGYRRYTDAGLDWQGIYGNYWSGSPFARMLRICTSIRVECTPQIRIIGRPAFRSGASRIDLTIFALAFFTARTTRIFI